MKSRSRTVFGLLFIIALLFTVSKTTLASSGGYIPIAATRYLYNSYDGTWHKLSTVKRTFSKDGKLKSEDFSSLDSTSRPSKLTYTWKGNFVTKLSKVGVFSSTEIYRYKNGLRRSYSFESRGDYSRYKYNWKKKTAKVSIKSNHEGGTLTVKVNNKKKITSVIRKYSDGFTTKTTYQYYKNGNLKKESTGNTVRKYNKSGYPTLETSYSGKTTYKYKMDKKKNCPKEVEISYLEANGSLISKYKIAITSYKKVSRIRNCDGSGLFISLLP